MQHVVTDTPHEGPSDLPQTTCSHDDHVGAKLERDLGDHLPWLQPSLDTAVDVLNLTAGRGGGDKIMI